MAVQVVAYGGSIINTKEGYNEEAINHIHTIVNKFPEDKFIFIIGGGVLARQLQVASNLNSSYEKDTIGIAATKINAEYVRAEIAKTNSDTYPEILHTPEITNLPESRIFFSGGWKPGRSTDFVAIEFAKNLSQSQAYKISNITEILDVKPQDFKKEDMDTYKTLTSPNWNTVCELVGTEWVPGLNTPLDQAAAKLGQSLPNFTLYLGEKESLEEMILGTYKGTRISN